MSKEEIALQLTLSKISSLQNTANKGNFEENINFNKELGVQIASLYTSIYQNLSCLDAQHPSLEETVSGIKAF